MANHVIRVQITYPRIYQYRATLLLGHQSILTTQRYAALEYEEVGAAAAYAW
jgi:hypothetical protein